MPAAEFAALLRQLKERSGLSYGTLAKRLHMSTSTLHRYCNGDAVPADYAPVERLARLCKAAPGELVELHRRWVLADAARGRKPGPAAPGTPVAEAPSPGPAVPEPAVPEPAVSEPAVSEPAVPEAPGKEAPEKDAGPAAEAGFVALGTPEGEGSGEPRPAPRPRTRTAVLAGTAVAAVLVGVTLAVGLPGSGTGTGGDDRKGPAGAASAGNEVTSSPSRSATSTPSASPSASPSGSRGAKGGDASGPPAAGSAAASSAEPADRGGVPVTVRTEPYAWESPCSQRYLIDRPPGEMGPPPTEQDAPAWVGAAGAVSSGKQYVRLTVQGTSAETVVVEALTVRIAGKRTPLAWNDFAMGYPGVGCGGGVPTRAFTVALDAARPALTPEAGNRDFPFKVSESDPEVYYITADASAYDVDWYLELKWSSGSRGGTLTVDDKGRPFRTSGNNGRPAYEFPLGGEGWVPEGTTQSGQM
ncbi:helix-turn-helix domain-containing protein [Streptomyces sp. CHD11]|uniref:transcriptional regulator n=1 Tax=Streptomyces sp. CHD11 TaxID=2741325 RepID=UPI001BFC333F|nr:transcriptional regulator [Streptomyces sp. CHD11]MBT3149779.1 helix-turn-helix domain-containing protein [Streptomyces sp. CHD11]